MIFDSNVVIDYLNAIPEASETLMAVESRYISVVTWIEAMTGVAGDADERRTRAVLDGFIVLPISTGVAEEAVRVRRESRLKLPDALIWATARYHNLILATRNTKDFPADDPGVRVPYRL